MFRPLKARIIARRVGPLVQGLNIDPVSSSEYYRPMLFLHPLGIQCSSLSLFFIDDLGTLELGSALVNREAHSRGFNDLALRMLRSATIPLSSSPDLDEFAHSMAVVQKKRGYGLRFNQEHKTVIVQIYAYYNALGKAQKQIEAICEEMKGWPEDALVRRPEEWADCVEQMVSDPDSLRRTVKLEAAKHGIDKLEMMECSI